MTQLKVRIISALFLALFFLGLIPTTAYAATPSDIVIGNNYTLESGNTLNDDLLIIGGNVNLMSGSIVDGNVFVIGGNLIAAGTVNGDMTVLGGTVQLDNTLILNGNLSTAGATVNRAPGAQITGEITTGVYNPYIFTLPGGIHNSNLNNPVHPLLRVAGFFLRLFLWMLVAMIVGMFIPAQLNRVSVTALSEPLFSWGLGLLTAIVIPVVVILLAITICLIPAAILGAILLLLAWAFGLIALGYELGKRMINSFKWNLHPGITAGIGTLVLMTVLNGLEIAIPCVGWIPKALVGLLGLGAVLLTQFGTKSYTSKPPSAIETPGSSLTAM